MLHELKRYLPLFNHRNRYFIDYIALLGFFVNAGILECKLNLYYNNRSEDYGINLFMESDDRCNLSGSQTGYGMYRTYLAFAAAMAAKELGEPVQSIKALVSANLMKNGMGVMVPGTGMPGLMIAAAVGALGGDAEAGLQALKSLSPKALAESKAMIEAGRVSVDIKRIQNTFYMQKLKYTERTIG